ncbi:MAG: phosphoribosyltransferase [Chloroflexi bacterium]|nr:phosphoribosyltransferase [Chloroflexota bacterium]
MAEHSTPSWPNSLWREVTVKFTNRSSAGEQLAAQLSAYQDIANGVVLGIPRGGVEVAARVAALLHLPLDVFMARKIGAPENAEFALGAVAGNGMVILDEESVRILHVPQDYILDTIREARDRIQHQLALYHREHAPVDLEHKIIIVVDDGVATGATMKASLRVLRESHPIKLIAAIPVGPPLTIEEIREIADETICLVAEEPFVAVGRFYENFDQVSDEEVSALLHSNP